MTTPIPDSPLIVALDVPDAPAALQLADTLSPRLCRLKVGLELFTAAGPSIVDALHDRGYELFLDLKLHDIPTTVAKACRVAHRLGVWMVDVHGGGGPEMLQRAAEACQGRGERPYCLAVTVLTHLDAPQMQALGLTDSPREHTARLATLARDNGLDGVVCSGHEVAQVTRVFPEALQVTPGIRSPGSPADDQRRTMTPIEARAVGADYLVIGRPVTAADDPLAAVEALHRQFATSDLL